MKILNRKFIIIFILALFAILSFLFLLAGEYFFRYTILKKNGNPPASKRNIPSTISQENLKIIQENKKLAIDSSQIWLESVDREVLSVSSKDNLQLSADLFKNNTHDYSIVIHGYTEQRSRVYDIAHNYHKKGFSVLTPDLRAHGKSDGKYIGMGWLDKDDIKIWIDKILSFDSEASIFLHGVSMGAATALMAVGFNLPNNVKLIIEDCGYTSVTDIFASEVKKRFNLPPFPLMQAMAVVTYFHAGYNIFEASSLNQISNSCIPILVLHGSEDNFVPVWMAHEIHKAAKKSDIFVINGADHTNARFLAPNEYYDAIWNFISKQK